MTESKPTHIRARRPRYSLSTLFKNFIVNNEVALVTAQLAKSSTPSSFESSLEDAESELSCNKPLRLPLNQTLHNVVADGLYTMPGLLLPSKQKAILTPTMGPELNLHETIINVTPPEIGEVVVRIAWTGLCGSDATFSIGPKPGFPARNHIAGHEGIGHIVQSWDPADLGKPVALRYMAYSCQACKYCLRGLHTSCPKRVSFPQHHNGSFQQFATVPRHTLIPLPDYVFDVDGAEGGVSPAVYTAALCSGSAAVKALKAANPKAGDVVVVIGIGGAIGGLMGLIAKHVYAAKVIGVDVSSKAGDPSLNIKTDNAVCDVFLAAPEAEAEERKFASELMQACRRLRGPNEVFDHAADSLICCSNRIAGFKNLVDYVCDGGTIIINGSPSDGERLDFPLFGVVERQINIHGHLMGGVAEMYQCLEYIRAGLIKPWIQEIDLSEVPRYLKNFKCLRNSGKVVARINGPMSTRLVLS